MKAEPLNKRPTSRELPLCNRRRGFGWLETIIAIGILLVLIALLLPAVRNATPAAYRTQCAHNLRNIALALQNYEYEWGAFPPAYTVGADGRPLHSWRTLILPYLEQRDLYESIDLSKAWDDPANAAARETVLPVYQCPSANIAPHHTTYLGIVGADGCFHPTHPRKTSEITDGTSATLMVIEGSQKEAVPWMSPQHGGKEFLLRFNTETAFSHEGGTQSVFVDGHVVFLSPKTPIEVRRALTTIAGDDSPGEF